MTAPTPVGFLDFFILEAGDYVEQLDAQILAGASDSIDGEAIQRSARALRGSATMAKLPAFAAMAAGMERVGRALRERTLPWDAEIRGVLVASVDDCKLLLRNVRTWSEADESRARARVDELIRHAPARLATPIASPAAIGHDSYLATESANIGAGLELLATRPTDRDAASNVLGRVRALRGIASVKDHANLADVLEAAEQAAHPLELGERVLGAERIAVLNAAATLIRSVSTALRAGTVIDPGGVEIVRFAAALDAMQQRETGVERVVPIADLFYEDGGLTVVDVAANPPTSPAERFRLEVVSQGEHLRRLVQDARGVRDELARERVRRGLRLALTSLRQSAESFGEREVAEFVASHSDSAVRLDARALDSLDEVALVLAQPGSGTGSLADRLASLRGKRSGGSAPSAVRAKSSTGSEGVSAPAAGSPPPASPTQASSTPAALPPALTPSGMMTPIAGRPIISAPADYPRPVVARPTPAGLASFASPRSPTPAAGGAALGELLERGIRTLGTLPKTPLSSPVLLEEQAPVPIDVLLYRGRAAIERAREIRDAIQRGGGIADAASLGELYDLLDLALTE